jgi:hypothetical protein
MNLAKCILPIVLLPVLAGCHVPLKSYRLDHPAIVVPPMASDEAPPDVSYAAQKKDCVSASTPICLAFIEVDDMGEFFDKAELDTALAVIRRANDRTKSSPPENAPVVITFIHGWKNNAAHDNDNVKGFMRALEQIYERNPARQIIGIYIGWRGDLIRSYLPVSRQFSYYNREATAVRVPGVTVSSALAQIAARTHENRHGLVVFIGHSFGGLLLERSVSEATASQIAQQTIFSQQAQETAELSRSSTDPHEKDAAEQLRRDTTVAAKLASDSRADLVIFINPAGAATESKQMLDFLADNGYRYQPGLASDEVQANVTPAPSADRDADRPLIVSLTSTADLATKVALPIGHGLPYLGFKNAGSFRNLSQEPGKRYSLQCFDPRNEKHAYWNLDTKAAGGLSQGSYYLSSTPHMQILQSHDMLKATGPSQMRVSSTGQLIQIRDARAIAECNRDLLNQQGLNIVSTFRLYDTQACFAVQERPKRCNGTPYWVMEIDPDIVPDHSTIFTQRLISFLIDTFFSTQGRPLVRLTPQLMKDPH